MFFPPPLSGKQRIEQAKFLAKEQRDKDKFDNEEARKEELHAINMSKETALASQKLDQNDTKFDLKMKEMGGPLSRKPKPSRDVPPREGVAGPSDTLTAMSSNGSPIMLTPGEAIIPAPAAQDPANRATIQNMVQEGRNSQGYAHGTTAVRSPLSHTNNNNMTAGYAGGTTGLWGDTSYLDDEDYQPYYDKAWTAESSNDPNNDSKTSTAKGYSQIVQGTWEGLQKNNPNSIYSKVEHGSPEFRSKEVQLAAMNDLTREQAAVLRSNNIPVNDTSLYAMHHLGTPDFLKVASSNDSEKLSKILSPRVIKDNPHLAGMRVGDFKEFSAKKMGASTLSDPNKMDASIIGQPSEGYVGQRGTQSDPSDATIGVASAAPLSREDQIRNSMAQNIARKEAINKAAMEPRDVKALAFDKEVPRPVDKFETEQDRLFREANRDSEIMAGVPINDAEYNQVAPLPKAEDVFTPPMGSAPPPMGSGDRNQTDPSDASIPPKTEDVSDAGFKLNDAQAERMSALGKTSQTLTPKLEEVTRQAMAQMDAQAAENADNPAGFAKAKKETEGWLARMISSIYSSDGSGLFNDKELMRFSLLAAGGLLTGGSMRGSLRYAAKDTLTQVDKRSTAEAAASATAGAKLSARYTSLKDKIAGFDTTKIPKSEVDRLRAKYYPVDKETNAQANSRLERLFAELNDAKDSVGTVKQDTYVLPGSGQPVTVREVRGKYSMQQPGSTEWTEIPITALQDKAAYDQKEKTFKDTIETTVEKFAYDKELKFAGGKHDKIPKDKIKIDSKVISNTVLNTVKNEGLMGIVNGENGSRVIEMTMKSLKGDQDYSAEAIHRGIMGSAFYMASPSNKSLYQGKDADNKPQPDVKGLSDFVAKAKALSGKQSINEIAKDLEKEWKAMDKKPKSPAGDESSDFLYWVNNVKLK